MIQNESSKVTQLAFDIIAGFMSAYHRSLKFVDQAKNISQPKRRWMVAIRKVIRRNNVNATKKLLLGKASASFKSPEKTYVTHIRAMTRKKSLSDEKLLRNTSYDLNSFMSPAASAARPEFFDPVADLSRIGSSDDSKVMENFERLYGRSSRHLDVSGLNDAAPAALPTIRTEVSSSSLGALTTANGSTPQSRPKLIQSSTADKASQFILSPKGISRAAVANLFLASDFSATTTAAKRINRRASPSHVTPGTSAQNSPAHKSARVLAPLNVVPVPIVTPIPTSHRKVPLSLTSAEEVGEEYEIDDFSVRVTAEISPLPTIKLSRSSHIVRLKALRRSTSPDTPRE